MPRRSKPLSMDAFAIRIGIAGFGAVFAAVLILGLAVTPAHRGGGPLLEKYVRPFFEDIGLWAANKRLKGENPMAKVTTFEADDIRLLVRFENEPGAEAALRKFRENRAEGRKAFEEWASSTDTFKGFQLATITPAGEAVVLYPMDDHMQASRQELVRISRQISQFPGVKYVDPFAFIRDPQT